MQIRVKKIYILMKRFMLAAVTALTAFNAADAVELSETAERAGEVQATEAVDTASVKKRGGIFSDFVQNTTFGGYVIGKYSVDDRNPDPQNGFSFRLIRLYADGKMGDFAYKLQIDMTGSANSGTLSNEKSPHVVDAWIEWQRFSFAKIKFGQFKRGFTFENPMHPWNYGFGGNSQVISKLVGYSDRSGEHSCGGRDFGAQLQGDLLPVASDRHPLFHYQVGVFNGQGINHSDADSRKDVIGGVWVNPIKGLSIGAFGWSGSYTKSGTTVDRNRWAVGLNYTGPFLVRAEYVGLEGGAIGSDGTVNEALGNKADGWYVSAGMPVCKNLELFAKWDVYRESRKSSTAIEQYDISANWHIYKNLMLQLNYYFTCDKSLSTRNSGADRYYNTADVQVYFRF